MNTLNDLGSWGSNLLGQAQTQLRPGLAAAADLATDFGRRGTDVVKSGAKAVRTSIKENLSGTFGPAHTFDDPDGGGLVTVNECGAIAEGAFGAVVKVADARTGEFYALKKIVCQEGVQVASSLEAAQREAAILRKLPPHPNIVRCLAYVTDKSPGGCSTVKVLMELCCGGHLLDFMDSKNGVLSPKEVMEPFIQITDAVTHLHGRSPPIQHRDLKVENVLMGPDRLWKLCDFGSCSTEVTPAEELSRPALLRLQEEIDKTVTMLYRPPEMADIDLNYRKGYVICEQVDIWMLGCILYTLAFYRHPFQDNATAMAISNAKYFIPNEHKLANSKKLCGLIHWLLAADPKDRPAAAQLAELLRKFGPTTYEDLHAMMPKGVKEKIQRAEALFGNRRREDPDIPEDFNVRAAAPRKPKAKAAEPAPRPRNGSAPAPAAEAKPATNGGGFDLRFALAQEEAPAVPRGKSSPALAAPPAAAPAAEADLLSFSSGTPAPAATAPRPAAQQLGMDDLLGFGMDGGGGAMPSRPVVGPAASAPPPVTEDWCDFAAFGDQPAPAAAPAPQQQLPGLGPCTMQAPQAGMGGAPLGAMAPVAAAPAATVPQAQAFFDDFGDFASAAPPAAVQPAAMQPAAVQPDLRSMPAGMPAPAPVLRSSSDTAAGHGFDLPPRSVSTPVMPVNFNQPFAAPMQQMGAQCGQAAQPLGKAEGPTGKSAPDLNTMLSQQANLLDL